MTHHSSDSAPPLEIKETTKIAAPITLIVVFSSAVVATALAWSDLHNTDTHHGEQIIALIERTDKLEASLTKVDIMQNDISWIRRSIEGRANAMPKTDSNPNGH